MPDPRSGAGVLVAMPDACNVGDATNDSPSKWDVNVNNVRDGVDWKTVSNNNRMFEKLDEIVLAKGWSMEN